MSPQVALEGAGGGTPGAKTAPLLYKCIAFASTPTQRGWVRWGGSGISVVSPLAFRGGRRRGHRVDDRSENAAPSSEAVYSVKPALPRKNLRAGEEKTSSIGKTSRPKTSAPEGVGVSAGACGDDGFGEW